MTPATARSLREDLPYCQVPDQARRELSRTLFSLLACLIHLSRSAPRTPQGVLITNHAVATEYGCSVGHARAILAKLEHTGWITRTKVGRDRAIRLNFTVRARPGEQPHSARRSSTQMLAGALPGRAPHQHPGCMPGARHQGARSRLAKGLRPPYSLKSIPERVEEESSPRGSDQKLTGYRLGDSEAKPEAIREEAPDREAPAPEAPETAARAAISQHPAHPDSIAPEPAHAILTASQQAFMAALGSDYQAAWEAASPGWRDSLLAMCQAGVDPVALGEARRLLAARLRRPDPQPEVITPVKAETPVVDRTTAGHSSDLRARPLADQIRSLDRPGSHRVALAAFIVGQLRQTLNDGPKSKPFYDQLLREVLAGRRAVESIAEPLEKTLSYVATGKIAQPGKYFATAVRNWRKESVNVGRRSDHAPPPPA